MGLLRRAADAIARAYIESLDPHPDSEVDAELRRLTNPDPTEDDQ